MEKVTFGKTGLQVSRLGFGGAPIGYLQTERQRVAQIVDLLLSSGVNFIDTAASYPGSEAALGEILAARRDQVVIVSKCGSTLADVPGAAWSAQLVSGTVDRSLRNLKTDHLDVMLLHSCDLQTLKNGDALGALVKAREAGKIRFAGYSGDNEAAAYAATLPDVAVIETSVSIADQANLRLVMPAARKNNIGIIAKRPVANAAWKQPQAQQGIYRNYAQNYHDRLKQIKLDPAKLGFSGENAWPELALRFTLSHAGVHTAIIGTTNPDNAQANIAYANKGALPADVVKKIEDAFNAADPNHSWTGQT
jgi:aryl-alcohol dehydrogenase-like predicted oxidoreductase